MSQIRIGVLALQGCVGPHRHHIESLGAKFVEVRDAKDLIQIDGMIIPGGESTTILKLIDTFSLAKDLKQAFLNIPIWGICAGAILIAREAFSAAENGKRNQYSFGLINISVERNAYGRQMESFHSDVENYPVMFIRAPKIVSVAQGVDILAKKDGDPIWVRERQFMATTFHPELSREAPSPVHGFFVEMVRRSLR